MSSQFSALLFGPGGAQLCSGAPLRLVVRVPADAEVTVLGARTGVAVRGVRGKVRVETVEGDVLVTGAGEDVTTQTQVGSTRIERVKEAANSAVVATRGAQPWPVAVVQALARALLRAAHG